jgi:hypothetical protein
MCAFFIFFFMISMIVFLKPCRGDLATVVSDLCVLDRSHLVVILAPIDVALLPYRSGNFGNFGDRLLMMYSCLLSTVDG